MMPREFEINKQKKLELLLAILFLAFAAVGIFLYFSGISRLDTLIVSFIGLSSMGIVLFIVGGCQAINLLHR